MDVNIINWMGIDNDSSIGNYPKNENEKVRSYTFLICLSPLPLSEFRGL